MDINEIRKRAQQAREKAADSMKKTFEKRGCGAASRLRTKENIFSKALSQSR